MTTRTVEDQLTDAATEVNLKLGTPTPYDRKRIERRQTVGRAGRIGAMGAVVLIMLGGLAVATGRTSSNSVDAPVGDSQTTVQSGTPSPAVVPPDTSGSPSSSDPMTVTPPTFVGTLRIESIGIEVDVVDSSVTDPNSFSDPVVHDASTPRPEEGSGSLSVIVGHNTAYSQPFLDLDKVLVGDTISWTSASGAITFVIIATDISNPDDPLVAPIGTNLVVRTPHPEFSSGTMLNVYAGRRAGDAATEAADPTNVPNAGSDTTAAPAETAPPTTVPLAVRPPIVFGDQVLLGAVEELQAGGFLVNAAVSRQGEAMAETIGDAQAAGQIGNGVVIHAGTNGTVTQETYDKMMSYLADVPQVVFLTVHADRGWIAGNNTLIWGLTSRYPNVTVLDWDGLVTSGAIPGMASDGIHLQTDIAKQLYANYIFSMIGRNDLVQPVSTYVIQAGDLPGTVADHFGISVLDLAAANNWELIWHPAQMVRVDGQLVWRDRTAYVDGDNDWVFGRTIAIPEPGRAGDPSRTAGP